MQWEEEESRTIVSSKDLKDPMLAPTIKVGLLSITLSITSFGYFLLVLTASTSSCVSTLSLHIESTDSDERSLSVQNQLY